MISLIVAVSENHVIGREGDLPWRLSADLRRFKKLTMGHHLIMGRKTYESIGRPLPGRTSVVITRQTDYAPDGVEVASSLSQAMAIAENDDEAFVIGGGQIYEEARRVAQRIYLTCVHAEVEGDTFFPPLEADLWRLVSSERHEADERNDHPHTFQIFERTRS